jgi:hypothetical protein
MPDHFTTRLQLPYPDIDDPANVPVDMQQLAERIDLLIPAGAGAGLVLNRAPVLDVGITGQVRAGRQLTLADFTAMGLSAPAGLWNLSDLTDASGNARALTNKGAVTFTAGINGAATTAAQFTGSTGQALYIADTGAADSFRIRTGSWGCWFRTAKRFTEQILLSKSASVGNQRSWYLEINPNNGTSVVVSLDGVTPQVFNGVSDVSDDRWHFGVATFDGTAVRIYLDGVLETVAAIAGTLFAGSGPLNISGASADAATAAGAPHFGRVDEAFVTADVLTDDQIRNLYCARLPHGYGVVPSSAKVSVTRRRRGGAWVVGDFPTQPLRLHNLTNRNGADLGSANVPLTIEAPAVTVAGADGSAAGGIGVNADATAYATDTGLPAGVTARSYGCWFKTASLPAMNLFAWGTFSTGDVRLSFDGTGRIVAINAADSLSGPFVADGQWHLAIMAEDNAAADGVRRKLYIDGRFIVGSTVLSAIVLLGTASAFRVGAASNGTGVFVGQMDGAFVCGYALTTAQVMALYAKGSQPLSPSPKNAGDHIEGWDAAAIYATFDTLDSSSQVDLGVSA